MSIWIIFLIYAVLSATGLFMIKTGADNSGLAFSDGLFSMQLSPRLVIGLAFYIISFLMSVYVVSRLKLSVFYPMSTGTILVITSLLGFFVLREQIGFWQLLGMGLILAGVVAINIRV